MLNMTDFRGRGAQLVLKNPFLKHHYAQEHKECADEPLHSDLRTRYFEETSRRIINKVDSPDIPLPYSANPYQGCEHGCVYCYARPTHEYWGFNAGVDFERNIIIKKNAAELLRKELLRKSWVVEPIMLSGNTDCYQPVEQKLELTRQMLQVCLEFRQPVSIITKNSLILRDLDILREMASLHLVKVMVSVTTLDEKLRLRLEPRTTTSTERLRAISELSRAGVPTGVMSAPIIPGLNSMEIPAIIKAASEAGAVTAGYTMVRLNGAVAEIFSDWLRRYFPDRSGKILNQIRASHGGHLHDHRPGVRLQGEGKINEAISQLFRSAIEKYLRGKAAPSFDLSLFRRPLQSQLSMF
ncbi:MAG: PA0069 family radical SAM protein [Bacteroidia bacterium]|nr:PA0069 family radical SAM protein [Bacteroidia bacterium]